MPEVLDALIQPWLSFLRVDSRVEAATAEDSPRLARIHARGFARGWDTLEFERLISSGALADRLVTQGWFGPVVNGFAISRIVAGEAELLSIALAPDARGAGRSVPLLEAHMARLRRSGAECLFLEVAEDNAPALALYRRLGFEEVGRRKGYYPAPDAKSPRRTALTMRRDLTPLDPTPRGF